MLGASNDVGVAMVAGRMRTREPLRWFCLQSSLQNTRTPSSNASAQGARSGSTSLPHAAHGCEGSCGRSVGNVLTGS